MEEGAGAEGVGGGTKAMMEGFGMRRDGVKGDGREGWCERGW